jgi:hypothetical protein
MISSSNITWPQQHWDKLLSGGFPIGTMSLIASSPRLAGKSCMIDRYWMNYMKTQVWNVLRKQNDGTWRITISNDLQEKIEWCRHTLGDGGNGKKSLWRMKWIDYRALQGYDGESIDVWFKEDAAMLFKLRWCD